MSKKDNIIRMGIVRIFFFFIVNQPDVIHILNFERFIFPILLYKFLLKGKLIVTNHSILKHEFSRLNVDRNFFRIKTDLFFERLMFACTDKIIFVSKIQKELARKYYTIANDKYEIIPNGCDKVFIQNRCEFEIKNEFNVVFYNGMSDYIERGLDTLISELNSLYGFTINLFIISGNINNIKINSYINIFYVAPMSMQDLSVFFKDKHIFIKADFFDSFSIMSLECLASGLILLITNQIGIAERITHGVDGFIYGKDVSISLGSLMKEILEGKHNLIKISNCGSDIAKRLTWDNIAKMYMGVYNRL